MVSSTTNHYPYEESAPTDASALLPVSEDDESGKKKPPPLSKTALAIFALAVFALAQAETDRYVKTTGAVHSYCCCLLYTSPSPRD